MSTLSRSWVRAPPTPRYVLTALADLFTHVQVGTVAYHTARATVRQYLDEARATAGREHKE
jgi:hypothetical protein